MTTIREFVTQQNITLPPIATKTGVLPNRDFVPDELTVEKAAYAAILAQYNAAGFTRYVPFVLGRLGVVNLFGPVAGLTILGGLTVAAQSNPVIAELLTWMAPGAPGIDLGNAAADELLTLLVPSVLTSEQKATLDGLRKQPIVVDESDVWNELHTWIEGRPV